MIKTKPEVRFESALRKTLCGDLEEERIARICVHFLKYANEFKNWWKENETIPESLNDEDAWCDECKRPLKVCKCE